MAKNSVARSSWKTINQTARAFQQNRMGDYRVALSANAAGVANQANQLGRAEAFLQGNIRASNRALRGLGTAARLNQRAQRAEQGRLSSQYGSGLSGIAATELGPANAQARATSLTMAAAGAVGKAGKQTANMMTVMAAQEVAAQGMAAKYQLAQALQQRTIVDNQTLAQLQGQVMQFEQAKALAKYNYDLSQKAIKAQEKAQGPGLQVAVDALGTDAQNFMAYYREHQDDADMQTPASAAQAWVAANITDPNEAAAATVMVQKLIANVSGDRAITDEEISNILHASVAQTIGQTYPHFDASYSTVDSYLTAKEINDAMNLINGPTTYGGASGAVAAPYGAGGTSGGPSIGRGPALVPHA